MTTDNVKEIVPKEFQDLLEAIDNRNMIIDDMARALLYEEYVEEEIKTALNALYEAFNKVTRTINLIHLSSYRDTPEAGLKLELSWYNKDSGDIYDDLEDGVIWLVAGVTQLTPAGERFKDKLNLSQWVHYG
jgi:hypothetical protein